ncbi:MAG: hypothetical protein M1827_001445 [Pycnora praestabilis]|nr:MAG: hypothetical protein M1827_001445 [Pycnora praestabilis]
MDTPRAVLLIVLLIFLFLSPDSQQPTIGQQRELDRLIANEHHALAVLGNTSYGTFDVGSGRWLNVTGLREHDGYGWALLPKVKEHAREQLRRVLGARGIRKLVGATDASDIGGDEVTLQGLTDATVGHTEIMPVYQNITGHVRGEWARSNIAEDFQAPRINLTALVPQGVYTTQEFNRNITGTRGKIRFRLDERSGREMRGNGGLVREISAQMMIKDDSSSGDGWEIALHGVHYPEVGGIVLATTSEKFAGLFALPHFTLSYPEYLGAQSLLNITLFNAITEQQSTIYTAPTYPWSSSPNNPSETLFPTPHCEYIVYLQQHPAEILGHSGELSKDVPLTLQLIEDELRYPKGAPLPHAPQIAMSMVIFSPDCGFVLESRGPPDYTPQDGLHLRGLKLESYLHLAKRFTLAFAAILAAQSLLLMRQMKEASTPSTRSRVSFYTIAIMSMGDGFACMAFLTVGMLVDAAFLTLITTAFLAFFCVSFFGMKFLMDIWTVQTPERGERERRNSAANPARSTPAQATRLPAVVVMPAGADTLPSPVTARQANNSVATPVILPPDQNLDAAAEDNANAPNTNQGTAGTGHREFGALYSRFYFLLLAIIFLSLHAASWPTTARSIYTNVLAFVYLSFWTPQIYRNAMRNCRKALRWEFVVGQSILRLTPFAYLYTMRDNILFVETDRNAAFALVGWVWMQTWALVSQEVLGPRFFVPSGWAPPAYDYHPVLRDGDMEAGATMPIGFTQAMEEGSSGSPTIGDSTGKERREYDCAICKENIDVPLLTTGEGGESTSKASIANSILGRRSYMVTPLPVLRVG